MGHGPYNAIRKYCSPHSTSYVFLIIVNEMVNYYLRRFICIFFISISLEHSSHITIISLYLAIILKAVYDTIVAIICTIIIQKSVLL